MSRDPIKLGYSPKLSWKYGMEVVHDAPDEWYGEKLSGELLVGIYEWLCDHPKVKLSDDQLRDFVNSAAEAELTVEFTRAGLYRAGALGQYPKLTPAMLTWQPGEQFVDEWSPAEIRHAEWASNSLKLTCMILGGSQSYRTVEVTIPRRLVHLRLSPALGLGMGVWSKWSGNPYEIVGFWLVVKLTAGQIPRPRDIWKCNPCIAHNKPFIKARLECPYGNDVVCYDCPKGRDQCRYAVHDESWIRGRCVNGHSGWFEPSDDRGLCIHCRRRAR